MKTLLITSLMCSLASLLGLLGLSAMTAAPAAETRRWLMMAAIAVAFAAWLGLAIWTRRRLRESAGAAALPPWLGRIVMAAGVVYVLLVLLFTIG